MTSRRIAALALVREIVDAQAALTGKRARVQRLVPVVRPRRILECVVREGGRGLGSVVRRLESDVFVSVEDVEPTPLAGA